MLSFVNQAYELLVGGHMKFLLDGLKLVGLFSPLFFIPLGCLQIPNMTLLNQALLGIILDLIYIIIILGIAIFFIVLHFKETREKMTNEYNNLYSDAINYVNGYNNLQDEATNLRDELIRVVTYAQTIEGEKQELSEKLKKANQTIESNKVNTKSPFLMGQMNSLLNPSYLSPTKNT